MKSMSGGLTALLQSARSLFVCELFTLTLVGGQVYRWSNTDVPVTVSGQLFVSGPIIERGSVRTSVGMAVPSCDVTFYATDAITVLGAPLLQAARRGVLDGAELKIERAFTDDPANAITGTVHVFEGRLSDCEILSKSARFTIKAHLELLDTPFPIYTYKPECVWALYGPGCGVSKAAHALGVTAQSGSSASAIQCSVTGSGTYSLGEIIGVTGANAGVRRTVKAHTAGQLLLSYPLPTAPAVGDTFTVYKGCDKTQATCSARFANGARFKGFPFVPRHEVAV